MLNFSVLISGHWHSECIRKELIRALKYSIISPYLFSNALRAPSGRHALTVWKASSNVAKKVLYGMVWYGILPPAAFKLQDGNYTIISLSLSFSDNSNTITGSLWESNWEENSEFHPSTRSDSHHASRKKLPHNSWVCGMYRPCVVPYCHLTNDELIIVE